MSGIGSFLRELVTGHTISTEDAWRKIGSGACLVDVRSPGEFAHGHLPGALNIPHDQLAQRVNELPPERDAELVLYCRSGARSHHALGAVRHLGYTNAHNAGGYEALATARPRD